MFGERPISPLLKNPFDRELDGQHNSAKLQIASNTANDVRGNLIEDAALKGESGALSHTFPRIDYFANGFGLSIKSHSLRTKDALLDAIKEDLSAIDNIENEQLFGTLRDGTDLAIARGDITSKGLLVAIPKVDSAIFYESGFLTELEDLANEYETIIKVVVVDAWDK